ncbi:Sensor protein SrrB [compost metagenome]
MSDAIVLIDMERKVIYANRRMTEMFTIHNQELLAMTEETLFDAIAAKLPDNPEVGSPFIREGQLSAKIRIRGNNDRDIFIQVTSFQVAGEEHYFGRGYVWRDITKEHEIDSLKNDLISLASHEFKTPITSIKGGVETLLRTDTEWEDSFKQELLEGIHEDIGRIQELIEEWLDISKIESGAMRINRQPLSIRSAIHTAMHRLPKHASFEDVVFDLSLDEGLPPIYADKLRFEQVLVNLFNNAIRYNHSSQPQIRISASQDEAFVYIRIQDNGIGIPSDHVDHIFDRFYRVDVSSSRQTGGTGLGLAICKGIVEAHGGHIRVQSELGSGSTFIISLPHIQWKDGYELEEA